MKQNQIHSVPARISEALCQQGSDMYAQKGFTLMELMVVILILGALLSIANSGWSSVQSKDQVRAAAEKIRSVMASARIKAVSVGQTQYVGVDLYAEAVATTADDISTYDSGAGVWSVGTKWESMKGVDLIESNTDGSMKADANTGINMYSFDSRGTASTDGTILVKSIYGSATIGKVLVTNGVTGRVRIKDCLSTCQ